MKKIIVSLSTIAILIFTGCFIDSDTATVRINLGNIPVAKVEKKSIFDRIVMLFVKEAVAQGVPEWTGVVVVHLGAFDQNNQLVAKKSINASAVPANGNITFDVPAGIRRKIVVLGEVNDGYIDFHGVSDEIDLIAGTVVTVPILMDTIENKLNLRGNFILTRIEWDEIAGASTYNIYKTFSQTFLESVNSTYYDAEIMEHWHVEAEFPFAAKSSNIITYWFC